MADTNLSSLLVSTNPLLNNPDQFPDILQYLNNEDSYKLVEKCANDLDKINKRGNNGGYTALHWACIKNNMNLIRYLVTDCHADINSKANLGETALFIATKNGNITAVEFLINYGANLYDRDIYERSVMHWAAYTGKPILLHYFKKYHKMDLNDYDRFKQNPLHIASASASSLLAQYLLKSKEFDLFDQDFNGNTCLHMSVKAGLHRVSWLYIQQAGRRLLHVENKLRQTPLDMISTESAPGYKRLVDYLKFETQNSSDLYSNALLYGRWFLCLTLPAYLFTLPLLFNMLIYDDSLNAYKGLLHFASAFSFVYVLRSQSHRINHVSGLPNPFSLGFFVCIFIQNYLSYFTLYAEPFNKTNLFQLFIIILGIFHSYIFTKLVFADPGNVKNSCKKHDGTDYEIKDLIKQNIKKTDKLSNDGSTTALDLGDDDTEVEGVDNDEQKLIFCDQCYIIIGKPTKHCKLCDHCVERFDHHCLFLNRCIGINNHRMFIILLFSSVLCIAIYLPIAFNYLKKDWQITLKEQGGQIIFFYWLVANTYTTWLIILFLINAIALILLIFLLLFQLNITGYGFTTQFRIYNLRVLNQGPKEYLYHLYIFFFQSNEKLMELYYKQQNLAQIMNKKYQASKKHDNRSLLGGGSLNESNSSYPFDYHGHSHGSGNGHGHNCSEHGHSH